MPSSRFSQLISLYFALWRAGMGFLGYDFIMHLSMYLELLFLIHTKIYVTYILA